MTFSEYALGLYPFLSNGIDEAEYFTQMIGNFVKNGAIEACAPLNLKPDTQYRFVKGSRNLLTKYAKYIYSNRDIDKFENWLDQVIFENDSIDTVCEWLTAHGLSCDNPYRECSHLLEQILINIINNETVSDSHENISEIDYDLIADIEAKIKKLPRPKEVNVPSAYSKEEKPYIEELYKAYGDAENLTSFTKNDLTSYPEYEEDLDERRVDYYAAESIRRGVQELKVPSLTNQFDVLKDSTYNGVKDTARKKYPDGYERMLSVMEQAVKVPVQSYLLSSSPYWISETILKGVCHHLVNDGRIKWVKGTRNKTDE
ncbi:MAG: hypothetical protein J6I68_09610 [Butyrivibrio sp.]|uniref:ABC-three component system protein n=1 Tax=Butyrivibrio sp. TaxID=28121 RepID=UPI001B736872|nr:ABC-three component system protein [Butyrivibrio sp.]MBP3783491.1 hypothetical protein [Butyrivibrio sp.]